MPKLRIRIPKNVLLKLPSKRRSEVRRIVQTKTRHYIQKNKPKPPKPDMKYRVDRLKSVIDDAYSNPKEFKDDMFNKAREKLSQFYSYVKKRKRLIKTRRAYIEIGMDVPEYNPNTPLSENINKLDGIAISEAMSRIKEQRRQSFFDYEKEKAINAKMEKRKKALRIFCSFPVRYCDYVVDEKKQQIKQTGRRAYNTLEYISNIGDNWYRFLENFSRIP